MNQELSLVEKKRARFEATIDILYLVGLLFLYAGAILAPLVGIIYAIMLKTASLSERGKKIGKICLILSIVGFVIWLVIIIIIVIIAVMASSSWY